MSDSATGHGVLIQVAARPMFIPGALHYAIRGREVPEDVLPGRTLGAMSQRDRDAVIRALSSGNPLADWALREVVIPGDELMHRQGSMRC